MAAHFGSARFSSSDSAASSPRPDHHPQPQQGKIIFACFFGVFTVIVLLTFYYVRRYWRQENQQDGRVSNVDVMNTPAPTTACKPEVVASLPVFVYSSAVADEKEKLECAVCLAEFREGEKGRVLPRCGHRFHAECIDLWLDSHCTCPLCRVTVESESESLKSEPLESAV